MSQGWQHRITDNLEERFGLLDPASRAVYKDQPVFEEPIGTLAKSSLVAMGVTCGIGSMLIGARDLGFQVIGNAEWRDYYRFKKRRPSTFVKNFPGAFSARGLRDIPFDLMPGEIDFVAGHPECGRYSRLSHTVAHDGGKYKESRGTDVSDIPLFLEIVAELRPRFFLMDDLPDSFDPFPMSEYVRLLPDYDLFPEWISNYHYGNIQKHRKRMFMIGALKKEKFTFWPGEVDHSLTMKDVLHDLVEIDFVNNPVPNHSTVQRNALARRYTNMRYLGDKPTWEDIRTSNLDWREQIPYVNAQGQEKIRPGTWSPRWDEYCPVLSGGFNPLHPIRRLPLSVRERARIQGFPDDFVFHYDEAGPNVPFWDPYSTDGQRGVKQTGKAMPVQFCTFFADQIKHHSEGRKFKASRVRQSAPQPKVSKAKMDFCYEVGYEDQDTACKACWLTKTCPIFKASSKVLI